MKHVLILKPKENTFPLSNRQWNSLKLFFVSNANRRGIFINMVLTFFQRYIVKCQTDVQPPAYLRKPGGHHAKFDFSPLFSNEESLDHK